MVDQKDILQKPTNIKVPYESSGKETLSDVVSKFIPVQLIPDKKMTSIFGLIFLTSIIIALFQFPYGSLMAGNTDIVINVGYPWPFLVFDLSSSDDLPIRMINLILDLFLYLILAYAINIFINLMLKNPLVKSEEELKKQPAIFKDRKPTVTEKVAEKVAEKVVKDIK